MTNETFPNPANEEQREIEGEGFVMKGGGDRRSAPSSNNPPKRVEFKPGETSDSSEVSTEERPKSEQSDSDFLAEHFAFMLKHSSEYAETLEIAPNGTLNWKERADDKMSPFIASALQPNETPDALYRIMREVQESHPELQITFENDPEGKWIKYVVRKTT